jgi:hypothetical protein
MAMKLRTGDAWMPADKYGQSLKGLTVNLLVRDIDKALVFQREVLDATVVYSDPDIAVLKGFGAEWMLDADHTYDEHAMQKVITGVDQRGAGLKLRLHGCDPDRARLKRRASASPASSPQPSIWGHLGCRSTRDLSVRTIGIRLSRWIRVLCIRGQRTRST